MILFHGTQIPPVSKAINVVKAPTLEHPFFMTDSFDIAKSYGNKGSLFIFRTCSDFEQKVFDIQDRSSRDRLGKEFGENLHRLLLKNIGGTKSLYGLSYEMAGALTELRYKNQKEEPLEISLKELEDSHMRALVDIGFIEKNPYGEWKINKDIVEPWKNYDMLILRRKFKAILYEKIYSMGYLAVKDIDTSTLKIKTAYEYAILDIKALDKVWPVSMDFNSTRSIEKVIEEMSKN